MPTMKNFTDKIKLLGRKMYLAYTSIRFLMFFSVIVLIAYLIFPDKMRETVAFVTAIVSAFTSIILAAIGANYMITKKYEHTDTQTQDRPEVEKEVVLQEHEKY